MGYHHPSIKAQRSNYARLEYFLYFVSEPKVFSRSSTMSQDRCYDIMVKANGDDKQPVPMSRTVHDSTLQKSLISRKHADATKGPIRSIPLSEPLRDMSGNVHRAQACIVLRWWVTDTYRSESETFYIVDTCETYPAMLRAGCTGLAVQDSRTYPLEHSIQTAEQRRQAEQQRAQEALRLEAERREQDRRMNEQINAQRNQSNR